MSITAEQLYERVESPVGTPYRFGLFSVLDGVPHEQGTQLGATWESTTGATAGVTNDLYVDPSRTPYTVTSNVAVRQADPFTVYLYEQDSLGSYQGDPTMTETRFALAEQHAVETHMVGLLAAAAPSPTAVAVGVEPSIKLLAVLGEVESQLADLTGGEGIVVMSRFAATLLGSTLRATGGVMRTPLGSRVAAIAGGDLGATMYGVGPLVVHRGPVETLQAMSSVNSTNDADVIAQRTYCLGWDAGTVAASTTL